MPRTDTARSRKENADIARQLIKDRDAGHSGVLWIKYINWTDEKGICRQERWTKRQPAGPPGPRRTGGTSTSPAGPTVDDDGRADDYDPLGRLKEGTTSVTDSQLIANAERGVTALVAGTDPTNSTSRGTTRQSRIPDAAEADAPRSSTSSSPRRPPTGPGTWRRPPPSTASSPRSRAAARLLEAAADHRRDRGGAGADPRRGRPAAAAARGGTGGEPGARRGAEGSHRGTAAGQPDGGVSTTPRTVQPRSEDRG